MPIVFVADAAGVSAPGRAAGHARVFAVWDGGAAWTEVQGAAVLAVQPDPAEESGGRVCAESMEETMMNEWGSKR